MAFGSRLKQAKPIINHIRYEFTRFYVSNQVLNAGNLHSCSSTLNPVPNTPNLVQNNLFAALGKIRFYAAPAQFLNKKEEEKKWTGHKLNGDITAEFVRLVSDEGHTVVSRIDALAQAKRLDMDLVEVDGDAKPVVCKIFDYKKEKFLQKVREKEAKKSKKSLVLKGGAFKEIKFASKISKQDLKVKADLAKRLMESGHRVKCTAVDPTPDLDSGTLLNRFCDLLEGVAVVEGTPSEESKLPYVVLRHIKFGPPKKSSKLPNPAKSKSSSDNSNEDQPQTENGKTDEIDSERDIPSQENIPKRAIPINDDVANKNPRCVPEPQKVPPTPVEIPKPVIPNRYARVNSPQSNAEMRPRQRFEPPPPQNSSRSNVRDSPANNYDRPFTRSPMNNGPNVRNQPQTRPPQRFEPVPSESSQSNGANSPAKSFGIFSSQPKQGQNTPEVSNRYKRPDPSTSGRNPTQRMDRRPDSNNEFGRQ